MSAHLEFRHARSNTTRPGRRNRAITNPRQTTELKPSNVLGLLSFGEGMECKTCGVVCWIRYPEQNYYPRSIIRVATKLLTSP
ncbi:hypothetical protein CEXT_114101 [Caerostris extrusa]|uniref:Uncharacterized protein n=1 Tax=Caerostris extrusa TaxID=172846 RepID=A0AAV4RC14_CAEEX|nr:hypothetical protein CEXT_114101 [Caerostris extrusa]